MQKNKNRKTKQHPQHIASNLSIKSTRQRESASSLNARKQVTARMHVNALARFHLARPNHSLQIAIRNTAPKNSSHKNFTKCTPHNNQKPKHLIFPQFRKTTTNNRDKTVRKYSKTSLAHRHSSNVKLWRCRFLPPVQTSTTISSSVIN